MELARKYRCTIWGNLIPTGENNIQNIHSLDQYFIKSFFFFAIKQIISKLFSCNNLQNSWVWKHVLLIWQSKICYLFYMGLTSYCQFWVLCSRITFEIITLLISFPVFFTVSKWSTSFSFQNYCVRSKKYSWGNCQILYLWGRHTLDEESWFFTHWIWENILNLLNSIHLLSHSKNGWIICANGPYYTSR